VALAAPGVDVWVARPGGGGGYVSGTSYAAPFVTAAVAAVRARQPQATPAQVADELERAARDLGAPGRDPVFGFGLLQPPAGCGR
jgi:subtilisin family serine protease